MRPNVLTPSFRNRLRLFFFVIVVVPMVAVALVLFQLVSKSDDAKIDARLSQAQRTATGLYVEDQKRAGEVAKTIASDTQLQDLIARKDDKGVQSRLDELARAQGAKQALLELQ